MSNLDPHHEVKLKLLKLLEENPNVSQRELAIEAGVSLGKLNYCLKALIDVGLIKANNFVRSKNKKNYTYFVTPRGVAEKTKMALRFLELKQRQFALLKKEIDELKAEVTK